MVVRALLISDRFATDAFRDLADRAAAATVRARKGIAYLTNTSALRAQNIPTPRACQECGFVDAARHEAGDPRQPLGCRDSFLWQGPSFRCVGYLRAYGPETTGSPTSFASLHGIFGTVDAEKVL